MIIKDPAGAVAQLTDIRNDWSIANFILSMYFVLCNPLFRGLEPLQLH